jgi:hypothetical protein
MPGPAPAATFIASLIATLLPRPLSAVAVNENVGYKTRNESQIEDDIRQ